ncbi:MAG: MoxR family ATPase [bacterium]
MSTIPQDDVEAAEALAGAAGRLTSELGRVIVGQDRVVEDLLTALLSGGHVLLVGVPGLAKTLLVSSLAGALDLRFSRIQFTPDLMPSDITGTEVLVEDRSSGERVFRFMKGPIFANVVLADEINRTPPKTQAALLEAMQEHKVTAGGEDYSLTPPFFVLATQNPIEQEGTYPLPEAQLDRFMFNIWIDYPSPEEEREIVLRTTGELQPVTEPVLTGEEVVAYQALVRRVPVTEEVVDYAVRLVRATRPGEEEAAVCAREWLRWGAGPRASQYLVLGAKARALLDGRLTPDDGDIRRAARGVLRHRLVTNFTAEAEDVDALQVVEGLLGEVPPP